ncbi:MAG: hypothetical protein GKR90_16315 [Pseudomonadales bacterium]|nr:hypothetical protein [Pseudomonadales bacterium]
MTTAAVIGAGVIGAGWVARFALSGWDVQIYDPNPTSQATVQQTLARARKHVGNLRTEPLREGRLTFVETMPQALLSAEWVQESLPESVELKLKILSEIDALTEQVVPICSSTSGFKPSVLGEGLGSAERFFVCHPFNPVYLIPLVEVVPHPTVAPELLADVKSILRDLEMKPLHVRREIDGHIADRLLEAVWREALWLIHDDVATTEEVDAAIKNGFGLRWAQMGLFETYRLGGGEQGMRHFLAQFGPALQWPWSKLTDVPNMDAAFIEKIATQSDDQAGTDSTEELAERRDANLVGILRALSETDD